MKLRNKKTGEIAELNYYDRFLQVVDTKSSLCGNSIKGEYTSISELSADWEDAPEESKGIKSVGNIGSSVHIELGSKEEAEKAVEKLKAFKRLKNKGFSFNGWNWRTQCIDYNLDCSDITEEQIVEADKDLDTLFGGEE